jgi:hypothetical protein
METLMKRIALIPAAAVSLLLLAAQASAADPAQARPQPVTAAPQPGAVELVALDTAAAEPVGCVRQTGTRIHRRSCLPGRSYDRQDIDRSGANTVADALRRLDPSVRIHR